MSCHNVSRLLTSSPLSDSLVLVNLTLFLGSRWWADLWDGWARSATQHRDRHFASHPTLRQLHARVLRAWSRTNDLQETPIHPLCADIRGWSRQTSWTGTPGRA